MATERKRRWNLVLICDNFGSFANLHMHTINRTGLSGMWLHMGLMYSICGIADMSDPLRLYSSL